MIKSPKSSICGNIPITRNIEIRVPRPRQTPMEEIAGLVDRKPIRTPAEANIVPDVIMVGNA